MRERLIELINENENEWVKYEEAIKFYPFDDYKSRSEFVADYLLENGVIVPPCKVGQIVWCIVEGLNQVIEGRIRRYIVCDDFINVYCGINGYYEQVYSDKEFGKTVFFTREEAETALKGGDK